MKSSSAPHPAPYDERVRVLVVEDEPKLGRLLCRALSEHGHVADHVGTGAEGVSAAMTQAYDAVVLDVMLPDIDGFEVCRRLRAAGVWTGILMLTARTRVAERVDGLDAGADDYLGKPFALDELLARLRAVARRGQDERPPVLNVGDLRLDPAAARVWRGETEIRLSARELAVLEAFMRRPGQVLTREHLLDAAWDVAHEPQSNVVDVCVRNLREKVDRPFGVLSLETVRGLGYRLTRDQP